MRWTTEAHSIVEGWELIGGPYKTLPLAKRCARQYLQASTGSPVHFRIRRVESPGEADPIVLVSAGLQGGWRIIWEPTEEGRRQVAAQRLGHLAMGALRDVAAHNGDRDPFDVTTGLKWGLWSTEDAADAVLADPSLTPAGLHQLWMDRQQADGWTAGTALSLAQREHPSLVAHQYLTSDEQVYDVVFLTTVRRGAELLAA